MMAKKENWFVPFVELGTRLRHKFSTDPFFLSRLRLVALYFLGGSFIYVFLTWIIGSGNRRQLYSVVVDQDGDAALQAIAVYEHQLLIIRLVTIILFGLFAYLATEFALRSIKKSSEHQKRFISIASHELRTPLTIMRSASDVALRNEATLTKEEAVQVIRENLQEIDRLTNTFQFLLTFTDLQNRNRVSDLTTVSLSSVVRSILTRYEADSVAAGIELTMHLPPHTEFPVRGNTVALEGMLANIVENALRYTPRGGRVVLALEDHASSVVLTIADTGQGISNYDVPYIFEPFYRGGKKSDVNQGSVGLGLSIVKEIAELHHAVVRVTSEVGKGTLFTITFPKRFIHT